MNSEVTIESRDIKMEYKAYFIFFEYGATCEGQAAHCGLTIALTEEDAIRKFLTRGVLKHVVDDKKRLDDGVNYYSRCVKVYDFQDESNHSDIRRLLGYYVSAATIECIMDAEVNHALHEFDFYLYTNYS